MADILNTTQVYNAADVVTHTNLNNIINGASFVTGDGGSTDNSTLEVDGTTGVLQVKDLGVTPAKLSAGGPSWSDESLFINGNGENGGLEINSGQTTNGIAYIDFHSNNTTDPDFDARIQKNSSELQVLVETPGNPIKFFTTNDAGTTHNVLNLDKDGMADMPHVTNSKIDAAGATSLVIKDYVDRLKPNIQQFVKKNKFTNNNPQNAWYDFGFEVSITPKFSNSKLRYSCSVSNSSDNSSHGNYFKLLRKVGSGSYATVTGALGNTSGSRTRCSFTGGYGGNYVSPSNGMDYIDSQSVTAGTQITYKLQVYNHSGVDIYINRSNNDGDNIYNPAPMSTATVEEIYQ